MLKLSLFLLAFSLFFITGNALFGLFDDAPQFIIIENTEPGARLYTGVSPIIVDNDLNQISFGDLNISQLGDVTVSGVANNQILVFNSSTLQWENQNLDVNVLFVSTGFLTDFNNSDLNANGFLNVQHDANRQYPTVTIFDSNELILLPDDVFFVDNDNIDVNLLSQTPIVGTWHIRIEAGEAQDTNALFIRLDGTNDQAISAEIQFPVGIFLPNTQSISFRDSDLNISSTANDVLNISSDGNVIIDANTTQFNRGCLKIEDTDGAGFTFCTTLNGVFSCSTGQC